MIDNETRNEPAASEPNGILRWIRRNAGVLVLAGVLVAWFQYHSANTRSLIEQLGERIESLDDNQKLVVEQLGARIGGIEADVRELRAVLRGILERLARIEGRLDAPAPDPDPDTEASGPPED